jgi:hypothetical protein
LDVELVLAAPVNEGGFGDLEFCRDAVEGPTLSPEMDEAGDCILIFHNMPF